MNDLEIFTDASISELKGRTFGSAGAYCPAFHETSIKILPDTTNNKSELWAIYLGVILAEVIYYRGGYDRVFLYSDSQFGIFGLTRWMDQWMKNEQCGIMYNSSGKAVKNQELFKMIIMHCYSHKFRVNFRHQKGHVRVNSMTDLSNAESVFINSNGYSHGIDHIRHISNYNNYIDETTRNQLAYVNPDQFIQIQTGGIEMCRYISIPRDYKNYIA